jgi:replicative DNA helicase
MTDRPAPQNLEAEKAILGCILLAQKIPAAVTDPGLKPEHFYRPDHGLIFNVLQGMEAIDTLLLTTELKNRGLLENAGGQAAVDTLALSVQAAGHLPHYVAEVLRCAERRSIIAACHKLMAAAYECDWVTIEAGRAWFRGEKPKVIDLAKRRAA